MDLYLDGVWRTHYMADGVWSRAPGWYACRSRPDPHGRAVTVCSYHGPHPTEQVCQQWCAESNDEGDE